MEELDTKTNKKNSIYEWRKNNKEKYLEQQRIYALDYYYKNQEKNLEKKKEYYQKNKDKIRTKVLDKYHAKQKLNDIENEIKKTVEKSEFDSEL
jgi:hypothetical protein